MNVLNKIAFKIAHEYLNEINFDFKVKEPKDFTKEMTSLFNNLPRKAKNILEDVCFTITDEKFLKDLKGKDNLLGLSKPKENSIYLNIEGISDSDHNNMEKVFFHEIGHYLTFHFTDLEKKKYAKLFGQEAVPDQEQDADSFLAWIQGNGSENINHFWNWWISFEEQ